MNSSATLTFKKVNSRKDLGREMATAIKQFQGKETEFNWEKREHTLLWIKSLLHDTFFENWKDIIIQGIHDLVFGIAGAIQSLRTKYALVAFDLIVDIGRVTGTRIDAITFETLFTSLLKCGNSSKQIVATKAKQTTVLFLSTTSYHNKAVTLLCSTFNDDKNQQSREFTAIYLTTCLETHAPRAIVRENMERLNTLNSIEGFLKTGLLDASPSVRQSCRNAFWIYHRCWPRNGERLLQSFNMTTRKQLEKSKPSESSTNVYQNTLGKRPLSPTFTTNDPSELRTKSLSKSIHPSPLSKRKASSNNISSIDNRPTRPSEPTSIHAPPLASATLLHLLRSNDISNNCNGLRMLSKRLLTNLHKSSSNNSYEMVLPSTVPSRADLMPILLDYLSLDRMMNNELLCEQMMSWDCLTGIFVFIFPLHQFLPTLILASQRHCYDGGAVTCSSVELQHCRALCVRGLKRIKLYLKYNDPDLFQSLLDILLTAATPGGPGLRDPNAKNELRKITTTVTAIHSDNNDTEDKVRDHLIYELVTWLDELVTNYVGLDDCDSDHDLMAECKQHWTKDMTTAKIKMDACAQGLDDNDKLESCLGSILGLLRSYTSAIHSAVFTSLITLIGRLRLVSIRVFNLVVDKTDRDTARLLDAFLGAQCSTMTLESQRSIWQGEEATNGRDDDILDEITTMIPRRRMTIDDYQQQYEPSFTLTSLNQDDFNEALSDSDDYDVMDTSLGSINLDIMSPEPSIASTQDPSELDDFTMEHTTSTNVDLSETSAPLEHTNNETDSDTVACNSNHPATNTTTLNDDSPSTDLLTDTVERLVHATPNNKHTVLKTLEHLCKEYSIENEADYGRYRKVWMRATTFGNLEHGGSLLKTLIDHLTDDLIKLSQQQNSYRDEQTMHILRLLKQVLVHQKSLLKHDNEKSELLAWTMINALIYTKREKYGRVSAMVDEIHDMILAIISTQSCMTITARLLKQQYDIDMNDQKKRFTIKGNIYDTCTPNLAPKLKPDLMNEFLTKKGCSDCFIQGINHSVLSIRQSCVNALVELSCASGDYHDIKHYLPSLRKEQQTLLDHYINQRR
ncbi:clasp N terminal-domain-containing protein [Absidia repens]|uniref:Clasp N terminal-domain-containing protein n=1 Tax=Absidia repens TaxID=90262 RepID=A0A1X2IQ90_9FUNG|nr:clasp N terminal-domain-containing protein [Absidia repens]